VHPLRIVLQSAYALAYAQATQFPAQHTAHQLRIPCAPAYVTVWHYPAAR